jgi:isoamylase
MEQRNDANLTAVSAWEAVEGSPAPLGPSWSPEHETWNFALYSRNARAVTLLLYAEGDATRPVYSQRLDRLVHKTGRVWHCRVRSDEAPGAAHYGYRVEGEPGARDGHRFDPGKVLLDPYAPAVFFPPGYSREACKGPGPTDGLAPLGVLPRGETSPAAPPRERVRHGHDTIVYELHVRGFTARASSGVSPERRGTFAGLTEKIPYIAELGVTVVELMPVHQYDPQEGNYWGYMTLHFFSPHLQYAKDDAFGEFRAMVDAFHAAGIEVWLDVVYNHTSEGDMKGPTYSLRGLDNKSYYLLSPDHGGYLDPTGCGNTLRCAHPAVRRLILDSLRFWAQEMRVDGFRFDLASIFTRRSDGAVDLDDPALIAEISSFGYYAGVRLVAEAWDVGSYQLGRGFPGFTWLQWNGRFRDDVRSFVRGEPGRVPDLMRRLYGSDDLFPDDLLEAYRPWQSVNFLTAHDGFCLYDLVSYDRKHNAANGHGGTDGGDDNRSWNCGHEGDTAAPPEVLALRRRQVRNFCCLLMLANGTPMFLAGDEFMNTQRGNNNPYNQDNETSWLDWDLLSRNRDVFRFFRVMIALRKAHPTFGRSRFWREDVGWHGTASGPDLSPESRSVAFFLSGASVPDDDFYVMINGWWNELPFVLQEGRPEEWLRVVDTSLESPEDAAEEGAEPRLGSQRYRVAPRSVVVLRRPRPLTSSPQRPGAPRAPAS